MDIMEFHNQQQQNVLANQAKLALRASHRSSWMAQASNQIFEQMPELVGRINWDMLMHSFNVGRTPAEAAKIYIRVVTA